MQKGEVSAADSFLTPAVADGAVQQINTSLDGDTKNTLKERAAKIYKQHIEITKLKQELKNAIEEKAAVELEIQSRNEEVYKMNEKMIFLEFQKQQNDD